MARNNDTPWVAASEVGSAKFCPQALKYKLQGVKPSKQAQQRMRDGNQSHRLQTKAAYKQQDQRCFVASYALGSDHPVTQELRDWRDCVLKKSVPGRMFIMFYYTLSPKLIRIFGSVPGFHTLSREAVLWLARKLKVSDDA
ncbi:CFI-box-CTERM domain-containing protein [Endozoicomonas sp. ALC066]|uniref:CFI-box-CTERM domain-containing protein n=1 Tax=Endozoicomonas sp. ALC066 TaxID=3403078 RepID=UPI003BB614B0